MNHEIKLLENVLCHIISIRPKIAGLGGSVIRLKEVIASLKSHQQVKTEQPTGERCPDCNGLGEVEDGYEPGYGTKTKVFAKCETCNGTGFMIPQSAKSGEQESRTQAQILEKHLGEAFYKTGELHNAIKDAMTEYRNLFSTPVNKEEIIKWIDEQIKVCEEIRMDELKGLKKLINSLKLPIRTPAQREEGEADTFEKLFERHAEWASKKFPNSTYISSLKGLKREAEEAIEELDRDKLGLEFADIQMYWVDALKRAGFTLDEIKMYFKQKGSINEYRDWKQNPDGSYSHIKSQP